MDFKKMIGAVVFSLLFAVSVNGESKKDSKELYNWLCNKPKGSYEFPVPYMGMRGFVFRGISKEEDISKFNYKWRQKCQNMF